MLDALSSIPFWGMALLYGAMGAAAGAALARRERSRFVCIVLLLVGTVVVAGGSASSWDLRTGTTPLGGSNDSDDRLRLEALGLARQYSEARRRWMDMSDAERWEWRLTRFGVVSASLLCAGVPTVLLLTRRAGRAAGDQKTPK
jgi:hypothetical protein